jgi:hypothetical protein
MTTTLGDPIRRWQSDRLDAAGDWHRASAMLRRSGHAGMRCSLCRFDPGVLLTKERLHGERPRIHNQRGSR